MNQIVLTGRLTHTPELRVTQNGKATMNNCIAVDRPYKNSVGEKETDFINIQLWESQAEFVKNYCEKGNRIGVVGRLQIRQYTDKDGNKRTATEVICTAVESLESKPKDGDSNRQEKPATQQKPAQEKQHPDEWNMPSFDASGIVDPWEEDN